MKFRKKPVVIEAVQWLGDNPEEVAKLSNGTRELEFCDDFIEDKPEVKIKTLEGVMTANKFDWIIKGVSGELYPCKPDIFEKTYEPVEVLKGEKE